MEALEFDGAPFKDHFGTLKRFCVGDGIDVNDFVAKIENIQWLGLLLVLPLMGIPTLKVSPTEMFGLPAFDRVLRLMVKDFSVLFFEDEFILEEKPANVVMPEVDIDFHDVPMMIIVFSVVFCIAFWWFLLLVVVEFVEWCWFNFV